MVDQKEARSRGFLAPVIGGIIVIAALVAAIYFRGPLWDFLKFVGRQVGTWLTEWVPDHPGQTFAIVLFAIIAFFINWLAHVRGRLRAWIFAIVVEVGLWLLFWFGFGVESLKLNKITGLNIDQMSWTTALISAVCVIGVTGVVFWWLEAREEWNKYRRKHNAEDD